MTDAVGFASSLVLLVTLAGQIYKQWQERTVTGVSPVFFIGECAASVGFIVFSVMINSPVFIVTNALTLLAAIVGQWVFQRNRRCAGRRRAS